MGRKKSRGALEVLWWERQLVRRLRMVIVLIASVWMVGERRERRSSKLMYKENEK